jgi:hypothetical protein
MDNKKPDNVVYDEEKGYYQSLTPYGTNVSAPSINIPDVGGFKRVGVDRAKKDINAKLEELKREYEKLVQQASITEMVYSSRFNFEPIVGNCYHLYMDNNGKTFLSLIGPTEWNREYVGSFILLTNHQWEKTLVK